MSRVNSSQVKRPSEKNGTISWQFIMPLQQIQAALEAQFLHSCSSCARLVSIQHWRLLGHEMGQHFKSKRSPQLLMLFGICNLVNKRGFTVGRLGWNEGPEIPLFSRGEVQEFERNWVSTKAWKHVKTLQWFIIIVPIQMAINGGKSLSPSTSRRISAASSYCRGTCQGSR